MDISETISLRIISRENDVTYYAYSDVPLLVKDESNYQEVRTYLSSCNLYHLLDGFGNVEGALTACLLWEWVRTTRSLGSFQAASPLLPYKEIIYNFNLLSGSLLVAAKAVPYVDTSCDYNNAWMSMSKVAVHCTSTQSLHCKTRNEVFKSFSFY